MASAAKIEKRKKLIDRANAIMKGVETSLDPANYRRDLIKALNYYNINHDDKEKKKWFLSYITKTDRKLAADLSKLDEYLFRYIGILARLMEGGSELEEQEKTYFEDRITSLKELVSQPPVTVAVKKIATVQTATIQDRVDEAAHKHAAEIDGAIDDFITKKNADFSTTGYLAANNVSGAIAKRVGEFYDGLSRELKEAIAGKDEQLVEGYSNFTKRDLKKFSDFVDTIRTECSQAVQTAKAARAPRIRKPVPAAKQVAKIKFMKEFTELGLKSVRPEGIIDAKELWVYNTKQRKLQTYKADNGLSVKGTTVVGFDVVQSVSVTIRKPEEFFKGLTMTKRPLNAALKTIKTKPAQPNGRINEECIILGAF